MSQATWKAYVVECKEDYDLLYREVREKRKIPINLIIVEGGKLEQKPRMYSKQRMGVLQKEHGFMGYLDETFKAPDAIMAALINRHSVNNVLVGGEGVQNSLDRKDLVEYLSQRESTDGRPGKMTSCFFYSYKKAAYKYTNQVSRYTGDIGTSIDDITAAKLLKPGTDPAIKTQLAETIRRSDEIIAELQPEVDEANAKIAELQKEGQAVSAKFKDAKRTKQDYSNYTSKLQAQRDRVEEAEENAANDSDKEKKKKVAKIKKLMENSM